MEILTQSARETERLGEKIGHNLKSGCLICLYGDLGSGKTTFIQGLARGLGIKKRILSPTFIVMRQYDNLYHIDLYRINDEKDALGLGLEEVWSNHDNIIAIEWPEKIESVLPQKRVNVYFKYLDENKRSVRIENFQFSSTNFQ